MQILSDEFDNEVKEKLKITNLSLDIYQNLSTQHFYYSLLIKSKKDMIRLSQLWEAEYQQLYDFYKFQYTKTLKGSEIEIYIKNNEKYIKINNLFQLKKLEIETLEEVVKMFRDRGWALKNAIEFLKLEKI
jgi:hypothetical protein